jgi:protein O-mannosyl-transferase
MSDAPEPVEAPKPLAEPRADWRRLAAGTALILLTVFAVYWPGLRGQFLWDDFLVVHRNPLVTGEIGLGTIWFRMDFPLTYVAFWLEWLAWGESPVGYHVVNVLLHAAGALLLWRVLAQLRIPAAWLAAMLFGVHPVCVGSVAWISELKNTLSLPFFLLSLLWYLRSNSLPRTSDFGLRTSLNYIFALLAFLLALLAKTSTVMLPLVLLGCAWWQRGNITRKDWLRTAPFFLLALAFGLMSIYFQVHGAISGATVQTENFWGRLAGAGMALWFYFGKTLLPWHLSMVYPRWQIDSAAIVSYVPLLLWVAVLVACWPFRQTWGRHVLFALGSFTVLLFPVLGFFDMFFLKLSRVSDHLVYLPLTTVIALAAAGLGHWLKGRALWAVGGLVTAALAWLAMQRAPVFQTEEALWRDTLARNPAAWAAHANLGWMLAEQQKYDEAREHLIASLEVNPDNAQAHSNLGRVLSLQRKFAEAEPHLQAALRLKPNDVDIRKSCAAALMEQGRCDEAVAQFREALRIRADADTLLQLASLLYQARRVPEAVAEYRQVLAIRPDQPEALNNLAWLLATCPDAAVRNGAEAVRLAERACRLNGYKEGRTLGTLAVAYAEVGRFAEATDAAQKAIDLARAGGNPQLAAVGAQLQNLFRAGKPYHEPAITPGRQSSP